MTCSTTSKRAGRPAEHVGRCPRGPGAAAPGPSPIWETSPSNTRGRGTSGRKDEMLQAFGQVMILLAGLGVVLLTLYWLTRYLPGAWRERAQVLLFAGPAVFLVF